METFTWPRMRTEYPFEVYRLIDGNVDGAVETQKQCVETQRRKSFCCRNMNNWKTFELFEFSNSGSDNRNFYLFLNSN